MATGFGIPHGGITTRVPGNDRFSHPPHAMPDCPDPIVDRTTPIRLAPRFSTRVLGGQYSVPFLGLNLPLASFVRR